MFQALPRENETLVKIFLDWIPSHVPQLFLAGFLSAAILASDYFIFKPSHSALRKLENFWFIVWIVCKLWDFYTTYAGTAVVFVPSLAENKVTLFTFFDALTPNEMIALIFPSVIISFCSMFLPFVVEERRKSLH